MLFAGPDPPKSNHLRVLNPPSYATRFTMKEIGTPNPFRNGLSELRRGLEAKEMGSTADASIGPWDEG